jgi:hypothetical protein
MPDHAREILREHFRTAPAMSLAQRYYHIPVDEFNGQAIPSDRAGFDELMCQMQFGFCEKVQDV